MGSSWKLGRLAGIPIYVHWTFFILIAYVVFGSIQAGKSGVEVGEGVLFVLALFGCVVLHELGHALAARQFGVPTADITLLPIGGIARLQRIPEKPQQELVVALAGPLVNFLIAGVLWLAGSSLPRSLGDPQHLIHEGFFARLLETNIFLALFNLLPAFPMDGGRVLRALLALTINYAQATRVAARVGQFVAIGFAVWGLMGGGPMLLLIAFFVWIGAESEAAMVEERLALQGVSVREAMLTDYRTLAPHDSLGHAAELLLAGSQTDFPVLNDGQVLGVLGRSHLMEGLRQGGPAARVGEFLRQGLGSVDAAEPLVPTLTRLREGEGPCLQVIEGGRPVGLLTLENIGEFLMVRAALDARAGRPAPAAGPLSS